MITKTKEVYYCDHCKKHGLSKYLMTKHEKFCGSNPANRHACYQDCKHLKTATRSTDDTCKGSTYFYCDKVGKMLHSFGAVSRKLPEKYPDDFEGSELMPTDCPSHERNSHLEADTYL